MTTPPGTALEVGLGKRALSTVPELLARGPAGRRDDAGRPVPDEQRHAVGLVLPARHVQGHGLDPGLATGGPGPVQHVLQQRGHAARFAESGGYEFDGFRPGAHHYRDWVIRALNRDLPYDEFVRMQIAGDVLKPGYEGASAVGFLVAGPFPGQITAKTERFCELRPVRQMCRKRSRQPTMIS